ncbi:MAG: sigma-70 family RNA polymerase sigma factor [Hyphomicrobium sp.]|nr:sigma-70 family RNA polymerase sigma factor [Hyphomicrobium sp.]
MVSRKEARVVTLAASLPAEDQGDVGRVVSGGKASGAVQEGDSALLARVAREDERAFRSLVDQHMSRTLTLARRILRDADEADDIAQETFLRLWRKAAGIDVGPAGVAPWLRQVATNLCLDRLRQRGRLEVTDDLPEVPDAPRQLAALEARDLKSRVDEALMRLPERQRVALTLFQYEGMSMAEVGAMMGISDEAVESLLARARRSLKVALASEWNELKRDGA